MPERWWFDILGKGGCVVDMFINVLIDVGIFIGIMCMLVGVSRLIISLVNRQ